MISRIAQGTQAQLQVALYVDGVLTNPTGSTTVTIYREDGTALVTDAATTSVATGIKAYMLSPAQTADLDVLTAEWTAHNLAGADQIFTTEAEIVGGFFFTVAEAQLLAPLQIFSVDEIVAARTLAEEAIEDVCGPFVEHYARKTFSGDSAMLVSPSAPTVLTSCRGNFLIAERATNIVSATVSGTAIDVDELVAARDGIYRASGWPLGFGNIEIIFWHGFKQVPALVRRAALLLTRRYLVEMPVDSRTTRVTQEGATVEFEVDPSLPFDIPEVNSVVERYGRRPLRLT